jgi:RNA recognition motif-containing protein
VVTYGSKVEADGAARNATGTEIRGNVVRAELVSGVEGAVAGTDNPASKAPPVSGEHDGSALVMVSGLGDRATDGGLRNHFAACGKIRAVQVALDKKTGEAKGFAYILFRKPAGAHAALALHKVDYAGSIARVALSSSARQIQRMIKMDGPPPNAVPKPREEDDDAGRANCDKGERILPNKKNGKGRSEKHEGTKGKPAKKRSSKKPRNET